MMRWVAAVLLSVAALSLPAVWNGFPLVFYDTGGYVERPFVDELAPGRGALYGLLVVALDLGLSWWPVVLAQGGLVVWLVRLLLRTHGAPAGPWHVLGLTVLLATVTSAPWFTGQLMPDALAPAAVVALYLLGFRTDRLGGWGRAGLWLAASVGMAAHMSTWALGMGVAALALLFAADSCRWRRRCSRSPPCP